MESFARVRGVSAHHPLSEPPQGASTTHHGGKRQSPALWVKGLTKSSFSFIFVITQRYLSLVTYCDM